MTGTPQNKHLEKIEDDQSINGINTIDDTIRNEAGRHWFVSQAMTPVIIQGYYNEDTGRYALGIPNRNTEPTVSYTTASQASLTLTCPAGSVYKVIAIGIYNATRAFSPGVDANIGGQAFSLVVTNAASFTQARWAYPIGAGGANIVVTTTGILGPIMINGGDTITAIDRAYVAADDTEFYILYEVI